LKQEIHLKSKLQKLNFFKDDFVKMIPGMARRMAEHRGGLLTELEHQRSSVEAPLLKSGNGSFGHHLMSTDETLYSLEATRGSMVTSQSVNSVIGMTHTMHATRNVPEGAEVGPVMADVERRSPMTSTMSRMQQNQHHQQQHQQMHQSFLYNNSPTIHSASTTLPRLVEKRNNHSHQQHQYSQHIYQQQQQHHQQQQLQPQQLPRHYVVATNGLSDDVEMDRTSFMNGDEDDDCDVQDNNVAPRASSQQLQHHSMVKVVVPPPPRLEFVLPEGVPPPPPSTTTSSFMSSTMQRGSVNGGIINNGNGTCGRKKKSVTIGTFTTVETFTPNPGDESV
jgi:hypothetical protein